MSSEILTVPEEHLAAVISVIRSGLVHTEDYAPLSSVVRASLTEWCISEENYLEELAHGELE